MHWSFINKDPDQALQAFVSGVKLAMEKLDEETKQTHEPIGDQVKASDECKLLHNPQMLIIMYK